MLKGNMSKLLKQAQEVQKNIEAVQMEIPEAFWPELEPLIVDWTATNFIEDAKHGLD